VTSFWLAEAVGRSDVAHEVLLSGRLNNPRHYHLLFETGRLYLHERRLSEAEQAFEAALACWPSGERPDALDTRDERRRLLLYSGLVHETQGRPEAAVQRYRAILRSHPDALLVR
jgi:tetratricopeptide (TPR) repeat protein